MSRKLSLVSTLFAISMLFMFAGNAMAACLFRMEKGGPILNCSTCKCDEMKSAGVEWNQCLDVLVKANSPKTRFDRITRYSDTSVTLHATDGTESTLASDASQKRFDEMVNQPNLRERVRGFKATAGSVSPDRLREISKLLGLEVAAGRTDPIKRPN